MNAKPNFRLSMYVSLLALLVASSVSFADDPNYFDPSHSSALIDNPTEFSLRWTDDVALDEYIFSFDNGTGIFVDDAPVKFTPVDGWWDTDWLYRRQVSVDNTAGLQVLTDHTVLVSIDTATLIAAGKMNPYGGDIRFVDPNGPMELDFWIEGGMNTADTRIWIEIPAIDADSVKTVYMYYGSSNHRVSQSDGSDTFTVFDDFGGRGWEENKYIDNPVMGPGSSAGGSGVFSSVMRESETLWRMYASYDPDGSDIGLSTSIDGIVWDPNGVVLRKGASGEWDSANIWCPAVWEENGTYYMLYAANGPGGIAMGLATSPDGATFTKYAGNPVFEDPDWAAGDTEGPCFSALKENGAYYVMYNTLGGHRQSSIVSSTDLMTWTRVYDYPRFAGGATTADWNYNTFCGNVFKYDDLFYLLIPGQDSSRDYAKFGMYVSSSPTFPEDDTEFKGIIMIGDPNGWEGNDMDTPWVVQFDDTMHMYYAACGSCWSQTGLTIIDDIPFALTQAYPPGNYIGTERGDSASLQIMPPVGWGKSITGYDEVGGQNFEITLDPAVTGRAVVIQDANNVLPLELYRDIPSLSKGSISAWMRASNTNTGDYDIYVYGDSQSTLGFVVGLGGNGYFHYWNGSFVDTAVAYSADTWYLVEAEFNTATDEYNFIVYDDTYAEILRVDDIAFGVTVSADIDQIDFRTSSTFDGLAFLDDVRVRALADIEPALSVGSELTPVLTESWSIVTKTLTSNVGATIRWKVTASDTSTNMTTSETYSFTTVAPDLPPEIVMNSPEDNSWSASSSITFSATCTDDADITSVSLYGDWGGSWALIDTHSDPNNGQPVSFTQTLPEGHWTWAIECTDNAAQTVTSSIRTIHVDATPQAWWHSGYSYRKRLIVTENAGQNLVDYPVHVTLDTASLVSAGEMQADCNDIRITYNGVEISSQVIAPNTSETIIWFQIDLLASQSDYEVYMYYGNPTDTAPDYSSQSSISWDAGTYTVDTGKITATFDPTGGIIGQIKHNMNDQDLMTAYAQRGLGYLFSNDPAIYYIFRVDEIDDTVVLTEDGPIVKVVTATSGESPQWVQRNTFYNNQEFVDFKVIRPVGALDKFLVGSSNITPDGVFSTSDADELLRIDNAASDINVTFDDAWRYDPTSNLGYVGLTDPSFTNQLAFFWNETDTVDFTWKPRTSGSEAGSYSLFIGGDGTANTYGTIDADEFDYRFVLSYSDTPSNAGTQADYGVYRNSPPSVECTAEEVGTPDVTPPVVTITSPVNTTYDASSVTLEYTVSEAVSSCSYSLDGEPNVVIPVGESVILESLENGTYQLVVYATDFAGHTGSASVSFTIDVQVQTWWDANWTFRVPVSISTASYDRTNEPIEHAVDFTQLFSDLGQSGLTFDINSVRVAEHDGAGAVIGEIISQFDEDAGYDAATNAAGTVIWIMDGLTTSGTTRYYYIYFDSVDNAKSAPAYATDLDWNDTAKAISNTTLQATIGSAGTRSGISSFQYNGTEYLTNNGMVYIDGAPSTYEVLIDGPVKKTIKLTATANGSIDVTVYDLAEFVRLEGNITGSGWPFTPFPYLWSLSAGTCTNTLSYYDDGAIQTVTVGGTGWLGLDGVPQEGWACYEGVATNKGFCLVTDADTLAISNNFWINNSGGQQMMMPGFNPNLTFPIDPVSWIVPTTPTDPTPGGREFWQDGRDFWNTLGSPVTASQGAAETQTVASTYDLTISSGVGGTIDPNGVISVDEGNGQAFTATPDAGYEVDTWLLDGGLAQTGDTEYMLSNITANHTVSVTFKLLTYMITASADENGSIDPNGVVIKDYGSSQAFTATADVGYKVDEWSVDSSSVQTGGTEYMLSDVQATHTVSVTFKPIVFTVSGHILNPAGVAMEDVTVTASGGIIDNTDPNGFYQLVVDYNWTGSVTPTKQDYDFDPNTVNYANVLANLVDNYDGGHITDLSADGVIDENDLQVLAENWLADISLSLDIYDDGKMDLLDFSILAEHWLQEH